MSACTSERVFHSGHLFWSFLAAISKCGSHLSQKSRIPTRSPSTILSLSTPSLSSSDCFLRSNQHKGSTEFAFIWVGAGFDLRQPTSHALSFDTVQLTHKRRPSLSSLQFRRQLHSPDGTLPNHTVCYQAFVIDRPTTVFCTRFSRSQLVRVAAASLRRINLRFEQGPCNRLWIAWSNVLGRAILRQRRHQAQHEPQQSAARR